MIDKGCFNVFLQQAGDRPVLTYRSGDSFGELALLYNAPRGETRRAARAAAMRACASPRPPHTPTPPHPPSGV